MSRRIAFALGLDFSPVDLDVKIAGAKTFLAGQSNFNGIEWRRSEIRKAVLRTNREMGRIAGNKTHGQSFLLNLVAGGKGNSATRKTNERSDKECAAAETMESRESQSTKILPSRRAAV